MPFVPIIVALLLGYLLGSIPFGVLLTKAAGLGDVRSIGSGNIGATNVLRTGRKDLAIATLLLDGLKGTLAVVIALAWGPNAAIAAALGAFLGHVFPVWLNFKGGKGVATFLGCLLGLYWPAALFFAAMWIATARATRYSSLSALVATALTPVFLLVSHRVGDAVLAMALGVLLFVTHRENIGRLKAGTESRIGESS